MKRPVYLALGFVFVAIGALGVVLPILPTTPFILLAAACFAQSSERWHAWLMNTKLFGPMLRNWEAHRCVSRRVKLTAIISMALVGGATLVFALDSLWPRLITGGLMLIGCVVVLCLDTCCEERS